ncbi:uncharacterized protein LDX57_002393 [Aspergillus melleus]|uniref:uncharacterized protein n=1 Tax=Aspergillus melleus TaxID=138277 RepID=UPI001E8DBB9F|nr:uncharacterized protein LDX57_002393 [Aspergillus melleus]KAH8424649.1 hypothetical protein LDX57_002393 [Aspergillus melleus]
MDFTHPHHHTTLFNPPDPSAGSDFTYDFNVRGTDHRRHRSHKVHRVDPHGKKEEEQAELVHDIVLGPADTLFPIIDGSQNSKEKKHAQDKQMTNGLTKTMDFTITDKVEGKGTKNQESKDSKESQEYVRGLETDEVVNNEVEQNGNDKTDQNIKTKEEEHGADNEVQQERKEKKEKDKAGLQRRQEEAAKRQRLEDEITETRTPIDLAEDLESKTETTTKVDVKTKEVPETKAKSKARILITRIKARFMKTVTELRK